MFLKVCIATYILSLMSHNLHCLLRNIYNGIRHKRRLHKGHQGKPFHAITSLSCKL